MSHLYSVSSKSGDQLCPLGFHPQVRWPTRCKRCFRDYKEHGSRRVDDIASSTPALDRTSTDKSVRSWTSTQNLSTNNNQNNFKSENVVEFTLRQRPSSWSSTPDLDDVSKKILPKPVEEVTVSLQLPRRRPVTIVSADQIEESFTLKRPVSSNVTPPTPSSPSIQKLSSSSSIEDDTVTITKSDSLAERVRKMQMMKRQGSQERESSIPRNDEPVKPEPEQQPVRRRRQTDPLPPIPDEKPTVRSRGDLPPVAPRRRDEMQQQPVTEKTSSSGKKIVSRTSSDSVNAKSNSFDVTDSSANVDMRHENDMLKREMDALKLRCEKVEREKSDILLRRLASVDSSANRTAASEALKLQQKVNEMKQKIEELEDEKKSMTTKIRDFKTKSVEETLRTKLEQAEKMCEALMDENEDMKKELKNMESEMDELQDNFREEQADEYVTVKKELEVTTKNCRILSFKLKKCERKLEQMELEKSAGNGTKSNLDLVTKIKQLEDELKVANEVARRLQNENDASGGKKKAPTLGKIGKSTSDGGKVSRESLTRGGSQEDPVQLLRDLQDSMEREHDLREQLKFAEEEAENLRKKSSRVDDENESLLMQVKKMASKARKRLRSPNPMRSSNDVEKDEGISDEEDTAELKLQLEINEQEASVLRRKVEDLENVNELSKRQISDLQEKLTKAKETSKGFKSSFTSKSASKDPLDDKKTQIMEEEINELRKKLIEKDRDIVRLEAENSLKSKTKLKSTTTLSDALTIDLKRQLQVVEQEASVLRTKTQTLESENEGLLNEVKKLQILQAKNSNGSSQNVKETESLKKSLSDVEKERDELKSKVKRILEDSVSKLPARTPKVFSDMKTKLQLKRMIDELEDEIGEARATLLRVGAGDYKKIEQENSKLSKELEEFKAKNAENKTKNTSATKEIEVKLQKSLTDNKSLNDKIQQLEDKLNKQDTIIKQMETTKISLDYQAKDEKEKHSKIEKELERLKTEKAKWETKAQAVEAELLISKKSAEKAKKEFEKELKDVREKSKLNQEFPSKKLQEVQDKNKELEKSLQDEIKRNSEFSSRYELLEEEHVLFKAQLTTEKEKVEAEVKTLKTQIAKHEESDIVAKAEKHDLSAKIADLQRKLTEAEMKGSKTSSTVDLEKSRLKSKLDEKEQEFMKLQKQNEMNIDQLSSLRKDNDDLRRKLDDFERINKAQRSLNDHNVTLENELKKLKLKLETSELAVKSEVAATRLRYETQVNTLQNELTSVHRQCERFKKDRDSFKQLLDAAQKNIGELKQNRKSYTSTSSGDEDDKSKIGFMEQQIGSLEDELSEARLESSKLRTEIVSEKTSFEIKISELQSKLNEYEEERLLSKSKVPGTRSRLELSWQKERDDQQRLLAETSTLARDLRQTLFEVERERDKERLESRRKVEQIKKSTEEELDEGRRKISELQSDLLELRDVHAKLRTANEKLRRDRDRADRESGSSKRRLEQVGERKVGVLLQHVDELVKIAPELQNLSKENSKTLSIPNPPHRSKSRSPSPSPSTTGSTLQLSTVLARLAEASDELRRYQRIAEEERERDRARRSGMRRAASQEHDNLDNANSMNRPIARVSRQGSLYRKSLSLDQSMQSEQPQAIWKDSDAGSMSSMQSLDSEYGIRRGDVSVDSRLSVGSTQSDVTGRRKKKKGIMSKIRSLASRGTESDASQHGSDSDLSLAGDRTIKKDLKDKISGIFKRAGSSSRASSRAGSQEKILDSAQRPISIASNGSSTLPTNFTLQHSQTPAKTKPPTPNSQRRVRPSSTTSSSSGVRPKI